MEQKLHTPEGVRDIYSTECRKKLTIQEKLHHLLHLYGYQDIQTPTFEYFDVFRDEIGTISSRELYKFFDRDGDTLALRPDITPSIARAAATLFEEEEFPARLCYIGNTFINHSSYQGRLKENTQLGAELIGEDSVEADAELIAMVVDSLKKVGLKEFQVNIGHVDFLHTLMDLTGLNEEKKAEVYALTANRNYFGVEEILIPGKCRDVCGGDVPDPAGTDRRNGSACARRQTGAGRNSKTGDRTASEDLSDIGTVRGGSVCDL